MASIAELVDEALRDAGVPIAGVSIVDPFDRSTWQILYLNTATAADVVRGSAVLASVAVDAVAMAASDAVREVDTKTLRAVVQGLWEAIPNPKLTKAALRDRILEIRKLL